VKTAIPIEQLPDVLCHDFKEWQSILFDLIGFLPDLGPFKN